MKIISAIPLLCILIAAMLGCDATSSSRKGNNAFPDGEYAFVVANKDGHNVIETINGGSPDRYAGTTVFKIVQDMVKEADGFALPGAPGLGAVATLKNNEKATITVKVTGEQFTIE